MKLLRSVALMMLAIAAPCRTTWGEVVGFAPDHKFDHGLGILFHWHETCRVLVPRHVLSDSIGGEVTQYFSDTRPPRKARAAYPILIPIGNGGTDRKEDPRDLEVLEVSGIPVAACGELLSVAVPVDEYLGLHNEVFVYGIPNNLKALRIESSVKAVPLTDKTRFYIHPVNTTTDPFYKGLSGALVSIDDHQVGIFLDFESSEQTDFGDGIVLRLDAAWEAVLRALAVATNSPNGSEAQPFKSQHLSNLADESCGARILEAPPPTAAGASPEILLEDSDSVREYSMSIDNSGIEILIKLCGNLDINIDRITLVLPLAQHITVEASVSSQQTSGYSEYIGLRRSDNLLAYLAGPTLLRGRFLSLRIFGDKELRLERLYVQ